MGGILYMAGSTADGSITTAKIADQAVTLAKLPHGTSSNDGKFLRANNGGDPTFETVSSVGGATGVDFNDDVKIKFGDSDDLQIYHDPSINNIIDNLGSLTIKKTDGDKYIHCSSNAQVELYHDNSKKLETGTYGTKTTGYHLQSAIPSFLAYGPNQFTEFPNADASYDMVLANTSYNTGTHYSTSTGRFTAPVAGLYFFHVCFYAEALSETHDDNQWFSIEFRKNNGSVNSNYTYFDQAGKGNNGDKAQTLQLTAIEPLSASDYFSFRAFNYFTTRWKWHGQYSRFMGYLIG
jgi:hypothetical protein